MLRLWGRNYRVECRDFRVWGLGFMQASLFRVCGSLTFGLRVRIPGLGFGV